MLRQNMANKMVAGVDYEKEADEIVRITAELKAVDNTMVKIYE